MNGAIQATGASLRESVTASTRNSRIAGDRVGVDQADEQWARRRRPVRLSIEWGRPGIGTE